MKNIFNHLPKRLLAGAMAVTVIAALSATAIAGFGPSRPTKAWTPDVEGFDHVVFNSFTGVGNGVGDERDFMRGVQVGRDSVWSDPVQNVTQDSEVEAKIYIHNNADARLNDQPGNPGVAKNVVVRAAVPTGTAVSQEVTSYISADNANPGTIYDTLGVTGANQGNFQLEYVPGSAQLHQNNQTSALSDSLVTTGVNIGDQKGCFEYVREVTFRMKVKMPQYKVTKYVRMDGGKFADWKKDQTAKPGDIVEWRVDVDNIGKTQLNDIIVLDQVPEHLTVVPGSVKLVDSNFPSGYVYKDSEAIQNKGRQVNVNIGNMNPGINGYVDFKTKIDVDETTKCGVHELVNTGYATPKDRSTVKDTAKVTVTGQEKCQPTPTPQPKPTTPTTTLPNTGPGDVAAIFAATSVAGAVAYNVFTKRRLARR